MTRHQERIKTQRYSGRSFHIQYCVGIEGKMPLIVAPTNPPMVANIRMSFILGLPRKF